MSKISPLLIFQKAFKKHVSAISTPDSSTFLQHVAYSKKAFKKHASARATSYVSRLYNISILIWFTIGDACFLELSQDPRNHFPMSRDSVKNDNYINLVRYWRCVLFWNMRCATRILLKNMSYIF